MAVAEKLTPEAIDKLVAFADALLPNGGTSIVDRLNRIETRLIATEANHRAVMDASGQAYWEANPKGEWIFATKKPQKFQD